MGNNSSSSSSSGGGKPPMPPAPKAPAGTPEGDAQRLLVEARGCFDKWGLSSEQKNDNAASVYAKAATKFKIARKYKESGDSWRQSAECYIQCASYFDAANSLLEAAKIFKMIDSDLSNKAYCDSIAAFNNAGKFRRAAKIHMEVAAAYEKDGNVQEAKAHYEQAARLFMEEDQPASASPAREKVAIFTALESDFMKASSLFETLARDAMEKSVTAFRAKKWFFASWIFILATKDQVLARMKLDEFRDIDPKFESSQELKVCEKMLEAYQNVQDKEFQAILSEWNNLHRMPDEQVHALVFVLRDMQKENGTEPGSENNVVCNESGPTISTKSSAKRTTLSSQFDEESSGDDDEEDLG